MTKLFIIGNGFDLDHHLPTTYNHFREYLRTTYSYNSEETPVSLVEPVTNYDGDIIYDDDETVHYLDMLISLSNKHSNWNQFESSLGHLDYSIINYEITEFYDEDGDVDPFHTEPNYESKYSDLKNIVKKIPLYFRDWINMIHISEFSFHYPLQVVKNIKDIINADEDIFLTFNYTHTLEKLYNAANVLHIHGEQESDDLLIGHGNPASYEEDVFDQDIYKNEMHDYLRKNTQECINQNSQFFEDLSNSDIIEIYSYGFSFGEVDLPYLKEIIRLLDTASITWYFHSFSKIAEREVYEDTLKRLGFEGDFSFF